MDGTVVQMQRDNDARLRAAEVATDLAEAREAAIRARRTIDLTEVELIELDGKRARAKLTLQRIEVEERKVRGRRARAEERLQRAEDTIRELSPAE